MASIFTLENVADFSEKLNIDDLYEKKKQYDLNKLALYNKILNRIHVRIKTTSRQKVDEHFSWFVIPDVIFTVPKYDQGACVAYLLDKLKENGFQVRYIHPNTLFICWNHWVPSYVRNELKKKTGIVVDEYGNKVASEEEDSMNSMDSLVKPREIATSKNSKQLQNQKNCTPIKCHKPQGNFLYDEELLNILEDKM